MTKCTSSKNQNFQAYAIVIYRPISNPDLLRKPKQKPTPLLGMVHRNQKRQTLLRPPQVPRITRQPRKSRGIPSYALPQQTPILRKMEHSLSQLQKRPALQRIQSYLLPQRTGQEPQTYRQSRNTFPLHEQDTQPH